MRKSKQKNTRINYAIHGEPMTSAEFKIFIEEAEKGLFLTEKQFQHKFAIWKKSVK